MSAVLAFGLAMRAFAITPIQVASIATAALFAQYLGSVMTATRFDPRSALVTTLSLSLLLRADGVTPLIIAALIGVGSKFMFRIHNKHIFNPANAGIVALLLLSEGPLLNAAWTTPGQWGTALWFAMLLAGAGLFVTYRAARFDVPLIFLGAFAALIFVRAIWLGDPLAIPLLRLQNGALILFAFFMISDPKTTPDGSIARAVFSVSAALIAYVLTYHFYIADGLFYALAIVCIARPFLELFDPSPRYQWGDPVSTPKLRIPEKSRRTEPAPHLYPAE
ncbi:RnfABCDGE type electron transport complex subunit D [Hyphococcus flavus]|uniref:RnfABCDGE type electron transport complex subunit D n=1 Tax=Hyphococcus flavus TaxID=1866326 RepID=A0AAF0CBC2_9PROT|nr:RnfABCDGE type electron transport complex subunit D [Hyphococcus flavus]WDI30595.1 RnfABCDGE type electron transport complex subunit D [Hyphococcus flavus]